MGGKKLQGVQNILIKYQIELTIQSYKWNSRNLYNNK